LQATHGLSYKIRHLLWGDLGADYAPWYFRENSSIDLWNAFTNRGRQRKAPDQIDSS